MKLFNRTRRDAEQRLVHAFDDCLTRIEGGAKAQATLARWPDLEGELAPMISQAHEVRTLFAQVAAPRELADRLERRLSAESSGPPAWREHIREWPIALRRDGTTSPRSALALAAIALLFVLVGGIALAQMSRPGDLLHPIKLGTDHVLDALSLQDSGGANVPDTTESEGSLDAGPGGGGLVSPGSAASETSAKSATSATPKGVGTLISDSADTRGRATSSRAMGRATPTTATNSIPATGPTLSPIPLIPTPSPTATMTPSATPTDKPRTPEPERPTKTPPPTVTDTPHPTMTPSTTPSTVPTNTLTPEPPPPTGNIAGSVELKESEDPVAGIQVVARRIESDPGARPFVLGETRATETNGEGRFEFVGLHVGFWVVGSGDPRIWWEMSEEAEFASPIEVTAGATRDGIRIRIDRPRSR